MMYDAVSPPEIKTISTLHLPVCEELTLPNGMPVYMLRGGAEPVMKMELVFRAGAFFEHKTGVAEVMASMLSEGTQSMSSAVLAETVEGLGATLFTRGGVDTVRVRLLTLTRFFGDLMPVLEAVVRQPAFHPQELSVYTENKVERLKIDLKKNEILAYRYLTETMFGAGHPYGRNTHPEDYQAIVSEDLHRHHRAHITPHNCFILLSGSFGDQEIRALEQTLGAWPNGEAQTFAPPQHEETPSTTTSRYHHIDGPQRHQAAIRIGRKLFPQTHPDFYGLYMLNTILGGYFGSRLMTEIRERKGLTYGIYSSVDSFAADGCFYISTETATANTEKMIKAIHKEAQRLTTELIPDAELDMARNYLMGNLMTQIDGPFAAIDLIKSMKIEGLDEGAFDRLVGTVRSITPEVLRELARTYLNLDEWETVVVD